MSSSIGIDDLNIDASSLAVDLSAIAAARGLSDRQVRAVEFTRRSVVPPSEDPVTLGVNAAMPLVEDAGRGSFELLIVATESGVDYGKPLSTYVHRYLGLNARCRNLEVKHACYGGTAAIQLAAAWARAGDAPGKKALVVMTDIARCHFGLPAELTAGCGAVAVVVGAKPRVLAIEPGSGYASREVYDVARPTLTEEWGDAVLSLAAYLDFLEGAWESYRQATGTTSAIDERFDYLLYHTPLVSLVQRAHAMLLEGDHQNVGPEMARASFDRMVRPALGYARELANIYSGSVYALLAGLADGPSSPVAGARIGIFSYGSGSCAELYGGVMAGEARATVARHRIGDHLERRGRVDVEQYARLVREAEALAGRRDYEPDLALVPGPLVRGRGGRPRLVLQRIENYHRQYDWVD